MNVALGGAASIFNPTSSYMYVNDYDLAGAIRDQRSSRSPHNVDFSDYSSALNNVVFTALQTPFSITQYPTVIPAPTAQDTSVVAYASASALTDGFITISGVKTWKKPPSSQNQVRSGIMDDIQLRVDVGQIQPGNNEFNTNVNGENIIYRVFYSGNSYSVGIYGRP